jgi:8-oxo-dGTP diphosphatase
VQVRMQQESHGAPVPRDDRCVCRRGNVLHLGRLLPLATSTLVYRSLWEEWGSGQACHAGLVGGEAADTLWAGKYPTLFQRRPHSWDGVIREYTVQLTLSPPSDDLVVNARLIAVENGSVVVCTTKEGWRMLPGGSREQGELIGDTVARELMEEAGCVVNGPVHWFASFTVTNHTAPWKSWHPYPVSAWLVGVVPVDRVGPPTNPADGEAVVAVQLLTPPNAITYLAEFDNGGQAELVALAMDLQLIEA